MTLESLCLYKLFIFKERIKFMKKTFRSVVFDQKSFEIKDGTTGMYQISDVKKVSVLNEETKFKGKTDPFYIRY